MYKIDRWGGRVQKSFPTTDPISPICKLISWRNLLSILNCFCAPACKEGDIESVRMSLSLNVNVNCYQGWGLRRAIRFNLFIYFQIQNVEFYLAFNTLGHPLVSTKKFQPNRSSRLAGYTQHIYECLVSLYRDIIEVF